MGCRKPCDSLCGRVRLGDVAGRTGPVSYGFVWGSSGAYMEQTGNHALTTGALLPPLYVVEPEDYEYDPMQTLQARNAVCPASKRRRNDNARYIGIDQASLASRRRGALLSTLIWDGEHTRVSGNVASDGLYCVILSPLYLAELNDGDDKGTFFQRRRQTPRHSNALVWRG